MPPLAHIKVKSDCKERICSFKQLFFFFLFSFYFSCCFWILSDFVDWSSFFVPQTVVLQGTNLNLEDNPYSYKSLLLCWHGFHMSPYSNAPFILIFGISHLNSIVLVSDFIPISSAHSYTRHLVQGSFQLTFVQTNSQLICVFFLHVSWMIFIQWAVLYLFLPRHCRSPVFSNPISFPSSIIYLITRLLKFAFSQERNQNP